MWTYLLLFLSAGVILAVFFRRLVLQYRLQRGPGEVPVEKAVEEVVEKEEEGVKISKDDKEKVQSLCQRGAALVEAGKDDEAIKCFVQALALDQGHHDTKHRLALLYFQKQQFSSASTLFRELGEHSSDPVHYSHLGLALYKQNDFESARTAYQQAVSMDPSRPQRFVSLAQVYRAMGQCNNAIITLKKALEIEEQNLDFLFLLADLYMEAGMLKDCEGIVTILLEANPEDKDAQALKKDLAKIKAESETDDNKNS